MCVCVCERETAGCLVYVCVCVRERETSACLVYVCVCVCVCVWWLSVLQRVWRVCERPVMFLAVISSSDFIIVCFKGVQRLQKRSIHHRGIISPHTLHPTFLSLVSLSPSFSLSLSRSLSLPVSLYLTLSLLLSLSLSLTRSVSLSLSISLSSLYLSLALSPLSL